jgi:hypothetical protein
MTSLEIAPTKKETTNDKSKFEALYGNILMSGSSPIISRMGSEGHEFGGE